MAAGTGGGGDVLQDGRFFVVPWHNSSELSAVYGDLFVSHNNDDRRRGVHALITWKNRMSNFYAVGLSATLALAEAEVKSLDPKYSPEDLQVAYASAFNRFLNYTHSLTMAQSSMYGAAKELGIHTFVVDVRHLCSHGANLPSLATFQRCAVECKKWLRLFYWDNLLKDAQDVTRSQMDQAAGHVALRKELSFLLAIYDVVAHQIGKRRKSIDEITGKEKESLPETFFQYANSLESDNLLLIRGQLLKDCSVILDRPRGRLATVNVFCRSLLEDMKYFFEDTESQSQLVATGKTLELTVVHQNFFHMIANAGIVGEVVRKLLTSSVDSFLDATIRKGAGYWAGQVLKTCVALNKIQSAQQMEMSPEDLWKLNWDSINTKSLDRTIEKAFAALGLTRENSLIFGVSKKNLWKVEFTRDFVRRQLKYTTAENKEAHLNLLQCVLPPLTEHEQRDFEYLIHAFVDPMTVPVVDKKQDKVEMSIDVTIMDVEDPVLEEGENENDMGIWSTPDEGGVHWEQCLIGSQLSHVAV